MLTQALNKGGNKPPNLVGPILAKELDLGSNPPQLDILEISELEEDRFRAMFRMKYEGDGYLVLQTQVQANPLRLPTEELPSMPSLGVVAAAQPLVVPMLLRISGLRLNGIIVLAVSKQDGVTLVFRSDPLVSVEVHSTFDSVPSVRRMLQREIEATLRSLFQDDLPVIVHEMSVNEIRRAREHKEHERRVAIEKQQQLIRQQHARNGSNTDVWSSMHKAAINGSDSGAASVESASASLPPHFKASQLHQRLMQLSRQEMLEDFNEHDIESIALSVETPTKNGGDGGGVGSIPLDMVGDFSSIPMPRTINGNHPMAQFGPDKDSRMNSFTEGTRMSGDPESLEQFLNDDWERTQQYNSYRNLNGSYNKDHQQPQHSNNNNGGHEEELRDNVVLRPTDNAVAARLASLMAMGQTLSPYTRRFAHTTMRSDVNARGVHPMTVSRNAAGESLLQSDSESHFDMDDSLLSSSSPPHAIAAQSMSPGSLSTKRHYYSHGYSGNTRYSSFSHGGATMPASVLATTPPLGGTSSGGVHSPFSRNRVLRRKVHRIEGISLTKKDTTGQN